MTDQIHQTVQSAYAKIARDEAGCGCASRAAEVGSLSLASGYTRAELSRGPEEANLGLSCGNPTGIAGLQPGETVVDLGSGAGFDCFLASSQVGAAGKVIGVDMTPEMIHRARTIARRGAVHNVEFRLGEIENLPVADGSVDVIISNCVINLVPDKRRVFQEAYRILKPGGRLALSDTALQKELAEKVKSSLDAHVACIAGAIPVERYQSLLEEAGFHDVRVTRKAASPCISADTTDPIGQAVMENYGSEIPLGDYVVSVYVEGRKA